VAESIDYGFSAYSTHTTVGMPAIAYWYASLIRNRNVKKVKNFQK
jgi:hypothetical protein